MEQFAAPNFIDNPVVRGREDRYDTVQIDVPRVLQSWQMSLFSYEWMLPDGRIKALSELPPVEQPKRSDIEKRLKDGEALEKPILGIGLLETVEIGSGRAVLLTLAAHGCKSLPVHIPKSSAGDFAPFLAG